ncbi:MAG: SRPBCC domain-containing protein [Gemmatimonadota bacterium]|nr:MAG: SRPBCC domain-containing protein [Gemmatimonadota bacterium]
MIGTVSIVAALAFVVPDTADRAIHLEVTVPAGVEQVWRAWTTSEGIAKWFAPGSHIELLVLGPYEILFNPEAAPGSRGAEDNLILAIQPMQMFSFTWDAPPNLPEVRRQRTSVVVRFYAVSPVETRVTLVQTGWGVGGEWDEAFRYFGQAWQVVLARLRYRFAVGPVDWADPPQDLLARD